MRRGGVVLGRGRGLPRGARWVPCSQPCRSVFPPPLPFLLPPASPGLRTRLDMALATGAAAAARRTLSWSCSLLRRGYQTERGVYGCPPKKTDSREPRGGPARPPGRGREWGCEGLQACWGPGVRRRPCVGAAVGRKWGGDRGRRTWVSSRPLPRRLASTGGGSSRSGSQLWLHAWVVSHLRVGS
jgi:hypothetical protein